MASRKTQDSPTLPSSARSGPPPEVRERLDRIWRLAYQARTPEDLLELYARWAESYDEDHEAIGFFGHRRAGEILARCTPFPEVAPVLDAGAGTGAAGEVLWSLGYRNVTALDLSPAMLGKAAAKGVYRDLREADLGSPLDAFPSSSFDAAVLVGVFSYGQAPAHALDEIVRVVRPGGVVVFTLRTDFHEEDAMGVRSKMDELDRTHAWRLLEATEPEPYLPLKDPDARFRVFCFRVLETKTPPVDEVFAAAVRDAFATAGPVHRIDHAFIWDSTASRLYEEYTRCPEYYLTDSEIEILQANAAEILGEETLIVELGCGSARKVRHLLEAAVRRGDGTPTYTPIDVSEGALEATRAEIEAVFGRSVEVEVRCGRFDDVLASIPVARPKLIIFFGGSIGNLESLEDTVRFLRMVRDRMQPDGRFVVGIDMDKDDEILRRAYEAGPANRSFFLNMVRRMNNELGANFDLPAFRQHSPCEADPPLEGIRSRCVQLRLVAGRTQNVYFSRLHMEVRVEEGDAIQVGTSRKFRREDVPHLAHLAGLRLQRRWFDSRGYFSLNEFVRDDAPSRPA